MEARTSDWADEVPTAHVVAVFQAIPRNNGGITVVIATRDGPDWSRSEIVPTTLRRRMSRITVDQASKLETAPSGATSIEDLERDVN